jgi:hypothetical protein
MSVQANQQIDFDTMKQQAVKDWGIEYGRQLQQDGKYLFTTPIGAEGIRQGVMISAVASVLFVFDRSTQDISQSLRTTFSESIAGIVKPLGDPLLIVPVYAGFYASGAYWQDERARQTAQTGMESILYTGLVIQSLKWAFHRHRPSASEDPYIFDGPSFKGSNLSFPSGHAAAAFSLATVIATQYRDIQYLPEAAYTLATLTALSRVHDNKHWFSDILVGSSLGYFISKTILDRHPTKNISLKTGQISPTLSNGVPAMAFNLRF